MKVFDILFWDVVPAQHAKYVYMMAGATLGGIVFALSQSWVAAIQWDLTGVFVCWGCFKIADPLLTAATNAFRFFFD